MPCIITAKKGEYTVKVKDNQPSLKQHIIDVLEQKKDKCVKESFNNCDYEIFLIDYKITEEDFPGAKAFICMHSHKRKSQANYNPEAQYFISSADNLTLCTELLQQFLMTPVWLKPELDLRNVLKKCLQNSFLYW